MRPLSLVNRLRWPSSWYLLVFSFHNEKHRSETIMSGNATTRIILRRIQISNLTACDVWQNVSRHNENDFINQVIGTFFDAVRSHIDDWTLGHEKIIVRNDFQLFPNHSQRDDNDNNIVTRIYYFTADSTKPIVRVVERMRQSAIFHYSDRWNTAKTAYGYT